MNAAAKHYGKPIPLKRDEDVLDTWFSSALWPFSTLGWPEQTKYLERYYPTDVLVTGFDIIFFWVARMMMMGLKFMGEVPFKTVYIHALVRDERGQKMSKSKGNIVDPIATIESYGCDALRFTLTALAAQGRDIKLAQSRIEGYRNFATKLWNAARFAEMNGCKLDPAFDPAKARLTVNRWIVSSLARTAARVTAAIEEFEFNAAADALYHFTWGTFCDWYVEFSKPILTGADEEAKAETRATTSWVLEPARASAASGHAVHHRGAVEESCGRRGGHADRRRAGPRSIRASPTETRRRRWIGWSSLIAQIRTARAEMNVPPGNEILAYLTEAGAEQKEWIARHGDPIKRLARLKQIHPADAGASAKRNSIQVVVENASLLLDLAGAVDLGKERARLKKEAQAVRGELDKIAAKLGNEQFIAKAKPEAVEEQRERETDARAALSRLEAALDRIGGA